MELPNITAVVGVSGVGKSSAIDRIKTRVPLLHIQASGLLKKAFAKRGLAPSSEDLRFGAVTSNQALLIEEFEAELSEVTDVSKPVVLDCHVVIEGSGEVVNIGADVFRGLRVSRFIFLEDTPGELAARRRRDQSRLRNELSLAELKELQDLSRARAQTIAHELGVPFFKSSSQDSIRLAYLISGAADETPDTT